MSGRWDIALRDLDYALALDTDGDTLLTWGEVRQQQSRIADYAMRRLTMRSDQDDCKLSVERLQIADHSDGRYASDAEVVGLARQLRDGRPHAGSKKRAAIVARDSG